MRPADPGENDPHLAAADETIDIRGERPAGDSSAFMKSLAVEGPGTVLGRYQLVRQLGEGGFGSVFLAEQRQPVVRQVALKIIKLGMDTRQVIARFEAERQALALMDHVNIAKVLDAGATDAGRPYFVMELVSGSPITEYCDEHNLTITERLQLFLQVCQGVQHAHQKGIIHRDIKPSNVLVSVQDGEPLVKVIDFGIAKATGAKLSEMTVVTQQQQMIGTPQYMSPEQAEGSLDIDTRTDVYSLGVILYELLIGVTPFDPKSVQAVSYLELQKFIRDLDPPKPSTRLTNDAVTLASAATRRRVELHHLGRMLKGELDWIVMKALEHERSRRYETANALAMDVQRYLRGEAVLAAPPSTAYRARKFVRRNKGAVIAAGLVAAALVLGFVGTTVGMVRAQRARANEAAERRMAEAERDRARQIAQFMSNTLEGVGPSKALGRDTTMLKEMMDTAARKILAGELKTNPAAEVQLRQTIGNALREIAEFDAARVMIEPTIRLARSLHGGDDPRVAASLISYARLLQVQGDLAGAEPLFREGLDIYRRLYPTGSREIAVSLTGLANVLRGSGNLGDAEPLYRESLELRRRLNPGDHPDVADGLNDLARLLSETGDLAGAEKLHREGVAMRRRLFPGEHPDVAIGLDNLAVLLMQRGDLNAAEPLLREAVGIYRHIFKSDHPYLAAGINNLASLLHDRGDLDGAEPLYREAMEMFKRLFPGDHPEVAAILNNLGSLEQARGNAVGAEPRFRESLEMYRRLFPGDHPNVATGLGNLARLLQAQGDLAGAEPLFRESLQMSQRLFAGDHPSVAIGQGSLAGLLQEQGDLTAAEPRHRSALEMFQRLVKDDHPLKLVMLANLGWCLSDEAWSACGDGIIREEGAKQAAEAEALLRECLAARTRVLPPDDWQIPYTRSLLGGAIAAVVACDDAPASTDRVTKLKEAEELLVGAYDALNAARDRIPTKGPARIRQAADRLVRLYVLWDEVEPAAAKGDLAVAWREKLLHQPPESPATREP